MSNGASGSDELAESTTSAGLEPRGVAAFVVALLFPGAGHLMLGRWGRALLLGGVILGTFTLGLLLHGRLYTIDRSSYLSFFFVFADIGSGLLYLGCLLAGAGLTLHPEHPTYEYGTNLMLLAGLLNYLVALNAYDVAVGRKR